MNIDEAIKFNLDTLQYGAHILDTKCYKALELGIEALKRINKARGGVAPLPGRYLPGETPIEMINPSEDEIKKLRESPIGEQ